MLRVKLLVVFLLYILLYLVLCLLRRRFPRQLDLLRPVFAPLDRLVYLLCLPFREALRLLRVWRGEASRLLYVWRGERRYEETAQDLERRVKDLTNSLETETESKSGLEEGLESVKKRRGELERELLETRKEIDKLRDEALALRAEKEKQAEGHRVELERHRLELEELRKRHEEEKRLLGEDLEAKRRELRAKLINAVEMEKHFRGKVRLHAEEIHRLEMEREHALSSKKTLEEEMGKRTIEWNREKEELLRGLEDEKARMEKQVEQKIKAVTDGCEDRLAEKDLALEKWGEEYELLLEMREDDKKALVYLRGREEWSTLEDVEKATGLSKTQAYRALARLKEIKGLEEKRGEYNRVFYRLT